MSVLQAVLLGVIQGLAEFLPVSSSGHLVLFEKLMGTKPDMSFDILLHLGTLVSVVIVFYKDVLGLLKKPFQKLTLLLVLATIPAVLATVLFGDFIEELFATGQYLATGFLLTGMFLLYADSKKEGTKKMEDLSIGDALFIGSMQAVAIAPAVSRSGSTIVGSLFRGLNREAAAKFSFLMSIPVILGASVLQLKDFVTGEAVFTGEPLPMIFGFVAAMLSGYIAVNFAMKLIKQAKLKFFAFYVFALAVVLLVFRP